MSRSIPTSLVKTTEVIAEMLQWPKNLGIELQTVCLPTQPQTDLLVVFVHGPADEELVRVRVLEPLGLAALQRMEMGQLSPVMVQGLLFPSSPRIVNHLTAAITAVLEGSTALFLDGAREAVLVDTRAPVTRGSGSGGQEVFGAGLPENVALIRERLRDPALIAEPVQIPRGRAAGAAVVYLAGRADRAVVDQVRGWVQRRAGEESLRRGMASGLSGMLGLLPHLLSDPWPDRAVALLDAGYVVVLVDRLPQAYIAPVTAPAILYHPDDANLPNPVTRVVRLARLVQASFILLAPAILVALMNYHQEMIPAPFLLLLASNREHAPFPIVAEVVGLQLLQELIREASYRLPVLVKPGRLAVAGVLLVLLMVLGGIVGPLPAVVSTMTALNTFGLPSYGLLYIVRIWRWLAIGGAAIFGLYGMTTVWFLLCVYLTQAKSFGVPFVGETGFNFTTPGRSSTKREGGRTSGP